MATPGRSLAEQPAQPDPSTSDLIEELTDSLALQRVILASLEDEVSPSEYVKTRKAETKAEIASIQKELAQVRKSAGKMNNPANAQRFPAGDPNGNHPILSGLSTPNNMSTPSTSSSGWGQTQHLELPNRKRNYSLEGGELSRPQKSRRTTPSPNGTALTTPSADGFDGFDDGIEEVIDLTGPDEEVERFLAEQKKAMERMRQNKRRADEDAEMARRLQAAGYEPEVSYPSSSSAGPVPGRNGFDRILGRSSQFSPGYHSSQPASRVEGGSTVKAEDHVARRSSVMPGTFDLEDGDLSDGLGPSAAADDDWSRPSSNHPQGNQGVHQGGSGPGRYTGPIASANPSRPAGYGQNSSSTLNVAPGVPAIELARQATLARQDGVNPASQSNGDFSYGGSLGRAGASPWASGDIHRPGMLVGGSYNAFGMPSYPPPRRPGNDYLANIIQRTTSYIELDDDGELLNDRIRGYVDDLIADPRKTTEEITELLSNIRPDMEIPEEDRVGTPDGLKYPLYPHQQLALQWMMGMEEGSNKGGILADDMGLGKTISTLALLLCRPPSDRIKTNLIVGPVSLVKQWQSEIAKKLQPSHSLSVFLFHGTGKNMTYSDLRDYDVVLTTYGKLGQQYKQFAKWCDNHRQSNPAEDAELAKKCPLVHPKSRFYRVILDEAQCIKNDKTQAAKGAHMVEATHRWCLTGTPMMNGVHELFSLIHFLRIRPYSNQKEFNKAFSSLSPNSRGRNASGVARTDAMNKLRTVLKAIMLRRMKNSQIDGKPILNLPPKTEETVHATFSEDEMTFYKNLENNTRTVFNKYLRAGTVGKNYSNILVLLLRLRQACCHPHLNLDVEYAANNEVSVDDMITLAKSLAPAVVARLKEAEAFECPICYDAVEDPSIVIPCGHDTCSECLTTLTERSAENNIQAGEEGGGAKCPQCRGPIHTDKVINYSTFKKVHMPQADGDEDVEAAAPDSDDDETASDSLTESDDETASERDDDDYDDVDSKGNLKNFVVGSDEDKTASEADDDDDIDDKDFLAKALTSSSKKGKEPVRKDKSHHKGEKGEKGKKGKKGKGKGKEKAAEVKPHMLKTLRIEARKNREAYRRYMHYLRKNWETSGKVTECCELLRQIQETGEKTIVFSQFTLLLDLLEIPIKHELNIQYCRYDGGMSRNQRDAAAQDFQDPSSRTKVMLVSLKAGNAGLNLTQASRVIIMDPFWNPYIEMQAVDRAHRIGQQRPVQIHRILVQNTVEDRIIELQEKKRELVDAALDEGESRQIGRLSTRELAYLFGVNMQ